ncbi:MAG: RNA 2'-phosphotransferase [Deltaproteobacteria bacterium]|jgi:putative RNA 2'-phosphotransferase|nr:RNA 2'-phosphotransferase [Deltaproteobacteria bacterium]
MDEAECTRLSKFLSFVLRHQPSAVGITLDAAGWVDLEVLLEACAQHGRPLSRATLEEVVTTSPKQRFAISADGLRIRANQGHSTSVVLGHELAEPPEILFHGTAARLLPSIREKGLLRMDRHHVHLSADEATARAVGARRGPAVVLWVAAQAMRGAGHVFFLTPNQVWLTDLVPTEFISGFPED